MGLPTRHSFPVVPKNKMLTDRRSVSSTHIHFLKKLLSFPQWALASPYPSPSSAAASLSLSAMSSVLQFSQCNLSSKGLTRHNASRAEYLPRMQIKSCSLAVSYWEIQFWGCSNLSKEQKWAECFAQQVDRINRMEGCEDTCGQSWCWGRCTPE